MPNLTREEQVSVYRSRLLSEKHPLKQTAFKVLFTDKLGKREERIKTEDTEALIQEFQDRKGGNVALARKELRERYKAGRDRQKIATIFNSSIKSDQQWVKSQVRKERYGDSRWVRGTLTHFLIDSLDDVETNSCKSGQLANAYSLLKCRLNDRIALFSSESLDDADIRIRAEFS